jgi:hypothetical protein
MVLEFLYILNLYTVKWFFPMLIEINPFFIYQLKYRILDTLL